MKKMLAVAIAILTLGLSSCTTFTPIAAGSGEVGARKGSATAVSIMGLLPNGVLNFGNNSMLKASKDAGVTHVATVDSKNTVLFGGLLVIKTTIVTGD
ncbi:MAG: TRL-like family protein [Treponema sp.]|nr:TRL-like family protein [Treponema sp.]